MMANGNLSACLSITLVHEGGYVDHPKDPGGATNMGITFAVLKKWRGKPITKADVRGLTKAEAERIYSARYWNPLNAELLPWGVDLATFDAGVNSGPSRGAKWLQAAVGVKQDGNVGPETRKAVILAGPKATVQRLCAKRLGFVQGLKTWRTFGKGWARRIADIEARGVAMWLVHSHPVAAGKHNSATVAIELTNEAREADSTAQAQGKGAAGTAAGGGVAGSADTAINGGAVNWWLVAAIGAAVLVAVIVLAVKARQNAIRAEAYRAVAAEAAK